MITEDPTLRQFNQDPKDATFINNPYHFYAKLHEIGGPIYWEDYGLWCLTEFDAVNGALRDSRFARLPPPGYPQPNNPTFTNPAFTKANHMQAFAKVEESSLLALEPPQHTRIRTSVNQAFANRRVTQMQVEIEALANQLIDDLEDYHETDLLSTYATTLPVTVIARLLGVPESECDALLSWSHAMVRIYTLTQTKQEEQLANQAASDFRNLLLELIKAKRKSPKDDLLSHLVTVKPDALSDDEIVSTAILLLNAGHEATVHQIGNTTNLLLQLNWPTHWIDDDPSTDRIIAEATRFDAPLHLFTRYAQSSVELYPGIVAEKGEQIALLLGAANRDPKRFVQADQYLPERSDGATVAFGAGLHFCVGAILAKLEMRIAINTLFKRLPNLELTETPTYQNNFHFHGLEALKVRW